MRGSACGGAFPVALQDVVLFEMVEYRESGAAGLCVAGVRAKQHQPLRTDDACQTQARCLAQKQPDRVQATYW